MDRLTTLRRSLEELFPERHLYVRSGGAMKAFVLTSRKQILLAASNSSNMTTIKETLEAQILMEVTS